MQGVLEKPISRSAWNGSALSGDENSNKMSDPLVDYLRKCCLKVRGKSPGCGFYIAPRLLVTCAHVVGRDCEIGTQVGLQRWDQKETDNLKGKIVGISPKDDIALLETNVANSTYAPLSSEVEVRMDAKLTALGFTKEKSRAEFNQLTAIYEGEIPVRDSSGHRIQIKFKSGQVRPGYSGGPLLNLDTGLVIGVVSATRDRSSDLGGWATKVSAIKGLLNISNQPNLPEVDSRWLDAKAKRQEGKISALLNDMIITSLPRFCTDLMNKCLRYGDNYRALQTLQAKVENAWLRSNFRDPIPPIVLDLEKRIDLLKNPPYVQSGYEKNKKLLEDIPIAEVFNQLGKGKSLVVLGEAGSGKTFSILAILQDLINENEANIDSSKSIPVIFNLSSWKSNQSIEEWLVDELRKSYKCKKFGKKWIKEQKLLILLDGLDEVYFECRNKCVRAINKFIEEYGQTELIVCSRLKEYEYLSERLDMQDAICIKPLSLEKINKFLDDKKGDYDELKSFLLEDIELQKLAAIPLMLNIMSYVYEGKKVNNIPNSGSKKERCLLLFDAYIEFLLDPKYKNNIKSKAKHGYKNKQSLQWLIWLSRKLDQQSKTFFLIEDIQLNWLSSTLQKFEYSAILTFSIGLILGLSVGNFVGQIAGFDVGVIVGLVSFFFNGLIFGVLRRDIKPVYLLEFSCQRAITYMFLGLVFCMLGGMALSVIIRFFLGYVFAIWMNFNVFMKQGIVLGCISGPILGLIASLNGPGILKEESYPNQGIYRSLRISIYLMIFGFVSSCIISILLPYLSEEFSIVPSIVISFSAKISFSLFCGFLGSGEACLKHFVLRLFLWCNGFTPLNYSRFLNYCVNLSLLDINGGSYSFRHPLILNYFKDLKIDRLNISFETD